MNQILPKAGAHKNAFAGIKVVDVDTHWSEPMDLWTSRAPASLKDLVPQVHMKDGARWWYIDGKPFGPTHHASAMRKDGEKLLGMGFWDLKFEGVHESSYDIGARLAMMDAAGVHAQIVYPHPTCLFPDALEVAAESLASFTRVEQRKILGGNAGRIYNIPL